MVLLPYRYVIQQIDTFSVVAILLELYNCLPWFIRHLLLKRRQNKVNLFSPREYFIALNQEIPLGA